MKKSISILFAVLLSALTCSVTAQTYLVSELKGEVKLIHGKQKEPVKKRQCLSGTHVLHVPASAKVVLLDSLNRKQYTIDRMCTGSVRQLIETGHASVKNLSVQYLKFLLARVRRENSSAEDSSYMQTSAHAYREGDSILVPPCDSVVPAHPCDSIK